VLTDRQTNRQTGRRLDSAPSPNVVAMATRVGPIPENPLVGAKISVLSAVQAEL